MDPLTLSRAAAAGQAVASVWAPVVAGVAGGMIGAGATLVAGHMDWQRKRQDQREQWQRERRERAVAVLRSALSAAREASIEATYQANRYAHARDAAGPDGDIPTDISTEWGRAYLGCVNTLEGLRAVARESKTRAAVDELVEELRGINDDAHDDELLGESADQDEQRESPLVHAMNEHSRRVRDLTRTVTDAVEGECQALDDASS